MDISARNPLPFHELPEVKLQTSCLVQVIKDISFLFHDCHHLFELGLDYRMIQFQKKLSNVLVKLAQEESFPAENRDPSSSFNVDRITKLLSLTPFMSQGLIRVGCKPTHASVSFGKNIELSYIKAII